MFPIEISVNHDVLFFLSLGQMIVFMQIQKEHHFLWETGTVPTPVPAEVVCHVLAWQ